MPPDQGVSINQQEYQDIITQHANLMANVNLMQLELVFIAVMFFIVVLAIIASSAWSVQSLRNDQSKMEKEWSQVLQLMAKTQLARRKYEELNEQTP